MDLLIRNLAGPDLYVHRDMSFAGNRHQAPNGATADITGLSADVGRHAVGDHARAEDGIEQWAYRATKPINYEQLLGALTVQVELLTRFLANRWEEER